jgi:hypothetical protein
VSRTLSTPVTGAQRVRWSLVTEGAIDLYPQAGTVW